MGLVVKRFMVILTLLAGNQAFSSGFEVLNLAMGNVKVRVSGFKNGNGGVGFALYDQERSESFPTDPKRALVDMYQSLNGQQEIVFIVPNLQPGFYAGSVYHDENGNRNLDLNAFGLPTEGVAVTRNAKGFFGPPSFDASKVLFDTANTETLIRIEY